MDFDGAAIGDDQGGMWGWQCQEYDLQKDLLAGSSSSLWGEANNIVGDDWSMFEDQTPIKHCADYEFQFCEIGDIIVKDFEEGKETLQAKRRRVLQFCPENVDMGCSTTENRLSESLQVNLDISGERCLLNSDGTDQLPEEWLVDCSQDSEPHYPPDEMNISDAAAMESTNVSVLQTSCEQSVAVHNNTAQGRPTPLKAGKSIIRAKKQRISVAFPFELIKPCSIHGAVTLNDINKKIHAPSPYKIRHKSNEGPNSSHEASAISGKPVVHKTKIHTEGGKGSITITRTLG